MSTRSRPRDDRDDTWMPQGGIDIDLDDVRVGVR